MSYIGLSTKDAQVVVSDGQYASVNFVLTEDVIELEEMEVRDSTLTGSAAAINQQRVAQGVQNIVNEDQAIDYRLGSSYSELRDEFGTNGAITCSNVFPAFGREKGLGVSLTASYYDQSEGFDNVDYDYVYLSTSSDIIDLSGICPGGAGSPGQ